MVRRDRVVNFLAAVRRVLSCLSMLLSIIPVVFAAYDLDQMEKKVNELRQWKEETTGPEHMLANGTFAAFKHWPSCSWQLLVLP